MLKKTIKYIDFNGVEREEDFYFNLTKAELTEMEFSYEGGLVKKIHEIVAADDNETVIKIFKHLILLAVGVKSDDGRRFVKSEEIKLDFSQTPAYSELFMELATDPDAAAAFVNAVIPEIPEEEDK